MIRIVIMLMLMLTLHCQSQATLTQPPLIETNTYTLRKTSANIISLSTTITYMQNYTYTPLVFVSLVTMHSFTASSLVTYTMTVPTITRSSFIVRYALSCMVGVLSCTFNEIDIDYLVFDYNTYQFVQILEQNFIIDPAVTYNDQFYQINYMQQLSHGSSYSLNVMLSGFTDMAIGTSQPYLYINAYQNNRRTYFLEVRFQNVVLVSFNYIRIIIDQTMMNSLNTGPSSLTCSVGTIVHYSDPHAIQNNPSPDFLPFAVFFGVSGFGGWNISLTSLVYIFNNTSPRIQANIGYILFLTSSCPANQLYVSAENLCYGLSSAFYYQATPATLQPCPYSCYQCVGPLTTQCRSCVQGWNRILSGGRCLCISGFYDPGAPTCKNCTQAISGCKTCSSATNCLTCLAGCNAIGFNPIYCDCPGHVQQNFSYNCPSSYYFDYTINSCSCLPQTYYNSASKLCFSCAVGCYICAKSSTYCLACIDSYNLINNTCIFFYTSYALLGQSSNYNNPKLRCIRWDLSSGTCLQKCKYYYYQANCYFKCPQGTFNISFPWLTCQPCPNSCQYCYNYTICYQCKSTYYYFNTSILSCSPCSTNCVKCTNASYCSQCQTYYQLTSDYSCVLPTIPNPSCDDNCNYCLISHQCLQCRMPYFLNSSSQLCISCSSNYGLMLQADGCHQICGDGKMINHQCDDGNSRSGDGCNTNCQIESGYQCKQINGVSRCWNRNIEVDWQIFSLLGTNNIIISFYSTFPLQNSIIDLQCGFKYSLLQRNTVNGRQEIAIMYQESVILMEIHNNDSSTIQYLSGNLTKSRCQATFNQYQTFILSINIDPKLFAVNYASTLESINNGKSLKMANTVSVYFTLGTMLLSLSPMTSYSSARFYLLFLVSFTEYMHIPINAFSPYSSLQSMLFITPSNSTKDLTAFSTEYYVTILWHLALVYVSFVVWLQLGATFLLRVSRSMEWPLLSKVLGVICQNKQVAYQNMYISYELIILCAIAKIFSNINKATPILIFLLSLQIFFIIISKIHFYFTYQQLERNYPQFTHTMVIQQFQNICIAFVSLATTNKNSYTPIVMIIFAFHPLLSLKRNTPTQVKDDGNHITVQMGIWQMRISCVLQIVIQALKMAFMWCGHLITSQQKYEYAGTTLGLCIGLLISATMQLGTINSFLSHLIRICEAKNQGRATIPSNQVDLQTVDASSHAD